MDVIKLGWSKSLFEAIEENPFLEANMACDKIGQHGNSARIRLLVDRQHQLPDIQQIYSVQVAGKMILVTCIQKFAQYSTDDKNQ